MNGKEKVVTRIAANPLKQFGRNNEVLRVAAYCRVSTDDDDQLKSYNAQKTYYTDKINSHPGWKLAGIYADEGITGTLVSKRKQFVKMIKDCEKGKIDLILIKSISRFARNTVDCLNFIRKLKALRIGIIFEEQNINTLTQDTETIIGVFSAIAQAESENISGNVKWGILKRMQKGTYLCHINMLGYRRDKITKEVIIIPEEAQVVRVIYKKFLDGYSLRQIKELLEAEGIKTYSGNSEWNANVIRDILQNEKYVGDILYQKTFRLDGISKKVRQNTGDMEKYLVMDDHEAIIDREIFNLVQLEFARRSGIKSKSDNAHSVKGRYSPLYVLNDLLVCGDCGSSYRRKYAKRKDGVYYFWRCISRLDNRDKYCNNHIGLEEESLHAAICRAISKFVSESSEGYDLIRGNLIYALSGSIDSENLYAFEKTIKEEEERIKKYSSFILNNNDKFEQYQAAIQDCTNQISVLRDKKEKALEKIEQNKDMAASIEIIDNYLKENTIDITEFDEVVVRRLISSIKVMEDCTLIISFRGGFEIQEQYYKLGKKAS